MDRDRITCCGGVAVAEFAMRLIEQTHGTALVNAIAKYLFSQNLRDAGSSQRLERLEPVGKTVLDSLCKAIKIMEQNLETPLPIAVVAQAANISQLQMDRLFAHYVAQSGAVLSRHSSGSSILRKRWENHHRSQERAQWPCGK